MSRAASSLPTSRGGTLANCTGDTIAKITDEAYHGIQRVCDSDGLVVGFLAHTGLTLDP